MKAKKIVLAGGSGFLGQLLSDHFKKTAEQIVVLGRSVKPASGNVLYARWDARTVGDWASHLESADMLINLTGKSVDCRYNDENKKEIIRSRVDSTRVLAEAITTLKNPPALWINSGSATIYKYSEDKSFDESSTEYGDGFSVDVCKTWENAFNEAVTPSTRKVILRISMVLGKSGGVLPVLKKLVRLGLGGKQGSGKQYVSWIHEEDFIGAIDHIIANETLCGPFNIASPEAMRNEEFMKSMRVEMKVPFGLPQATWMLEIGAFLIRTETELVLKSRKVFPQKLLSSGYSFRFPTVKSALANLLK
jgi:uncharacterized protein (TIGR01777 family)